MVKILDIDIILDRSIFFKFFLFHLKVFLWEFHVLHFDHIHPSPGFNTTPLMHELCDFFRPLQSNLSCLHTIRCVVLHCSMIDLPGAPSLKPTLPLPTVLRCYKVSSQKWDLCQLPSAGICPVQFLWILSQLLWIRMYHWSVVSIKHGFLAVIYCLWLLQSLCPFFCNHPWALGGWVVI